MKYCNKCEKDVETKWKFGQERCLECSSVIGVPIKYDHYVFLGTNELNRRSIVDLRKHDLIDDF